jgi:hypothetical protein
MPTNDEPKAQALSRYTHFDWSMKRLLRDKAGFAVLNGFLTTLMGRSKRNPVEILRVLENDDNTRTPLTRSNSAIVLATDGWGSNIAFNLQNITQKDYHCRIYFGAPKAPCDFETAGTFYGSIKHIYSVNIYYLRFGAGDDYFYRSQTTFHGNRAYDDLYLGPPDQQQIVSHAVNVMFPEYLILRVGNFAKPPDSPLEQWMHFLKNGEIPDDFTALGLPEARELLRVDRLTPEDRKSYQSHLESMHRERTMNWSVWAEGAVEGLRRAAREKLDVGMDPEFVSKTTGFSIAEILEPPCDFSGQPLQQPTSQLSLAA